MLLKLIRRLRRDKKGQGLVEYGLLIGGVALIGAGAVSLFGHKTSDIIASTAAILPGAHTDDNNPITSGHLIETAVQANGGIGLDATTIKTNSNTARLGNNIMGTDPTGGSFGGLVLESN